MLTEKLLIDFASLLEGHTYIKGKDGQDVMTLEGLFSKAEVVNGNRRTYPAPILKRAIDRLCEKVNDRAVTGELGHPADRIESLPQLESHLITRLTWVDPGKEVFGLLEVLNYGPGSMGYLLEQRILHKVKTGISSRATGSTEPTEVSGVVRVCEDLAIATYDIVTDPSNPGSWVGLKEARLYEQVLQESQKQVGNRTMDADFKKLIFAYFDVLNSKQY
jgi:hypothetical protein